MNKRLAFMVWIWSTVAATIAVLTGGTVGIILNSGTLGNLCAMWAVATFLSGMGMAMTFGPGGAKMPPPSGPRLSREARRDLRRTQEAIDLHRRINEAERAAGVPITQWHPDEDTPKGMTSDVRDHL